MFTESSQPLRFV